VRASGRQVKVRPRLEATTGQINDRNRLFLPTRRVDAAEGGRQRMIHEDRQVIKETKPLQRPTGLSLLDNDKKKQ
jgi:hypothetical protein